MSTIEEAREQARKELDYLRRAIDGPHAAGTLLDSYTLAHISGVLDEVEPALRALLDATEPPTDGEHDFDPVYGGCRKCAALPGDGPCEPPEPWGRDPRQRAEYLAASKAEHALGEWRGGEVDEPAEDEREALFRLWSEHGAGYESSDAEGYEMADAILAAGYRKGPRPITDEMVEDAREAWADWSEQSEPGTDWESFRAGYRAALEAAEGARR